ncbi:MAG: phosphoribosyl-AMP cyclohydrolase [Candidatus Omnitrophica bacterium]|nr:phosphoribosyl-AMP cyclohydrolase [Candidatus Omnitrophota bacterium]
MIKDIKFNDKGLIPAVIQDEKRKEVLTLCYMNKEALQKTMDEGKVYVFRRSRNALMLKGGSSGHIQIVKSIYIDCEGNSILIKVEQKTAACHAGYFTCYYRAISKDGSVKIVDEMVFNPKEVYK